MSKEHIYVDRGLKSYFLNIYQYVALNLVLAGAVGFYIASNRQLFDLIIASPLFFIIALAPIGISWYMGAKINEISISHARILYWIYGATIGASLSTVFLAFSTASIFKCFFISAAIFGAAALFGRLTSTDLSSMRSTLMIGLFGIIIVSLINMFLGNSLIEYLVSWAIIAVFSGLIAFEMQQLLAIYFTRNSDEMIEKISIIGALNLFISFINIFVAVLRLFGERRDR